MERLTKQSVTVEAGAEDFLYPNFHLRSCTDKLLDLVMNGPTINGVNKDSLRSYIRVLYTVLKSIEDILGPTYDLSRLRELVEADREGRVPPVSVGQTLYVISHEGVDEEKVVGIISDGKTTMVEISHFLGVYEYSEKNFGKWVFLTREAAVKALEEKDGG